MPNRKILRLQKYYISKDRYQELFYFCKRYGEREEEIKSLYGLAGCNLDSTPRGSDVGNKTESTALKILKLKEENDIIVETAKEVDKNIYLFIIKNITEGIPYDYMNVPCGKRQFYEKRRLFFKKLAEKK